MTRGVGHFKGSRLHAFKWSPLNLKSDARHIFLLINILVFQVRDAAVYETSRSAILAWAMASLAAVMC